LITYETVSFLRKRTTEGEAQRTGTTIRRAVLSTYSNQIANTCAYYIMKARIRLIPILLTLAISSCENDDTALIPVIEGLSLYWDHEVFGEQGRRLRFEFTTSNEFDNDYELIFNYSIDRNSITARLVKSVVDGKCQFYPMPSIGNDDPHKCNASGGFYIPDDELTNGTYVFKIITPFFQATSELTVTDEEVTLNIPANDHLATTINHVYPIPRNILFGNVVFEGSENSQDAEDFFKDLISSGLTEIALPAHPYRYLIVDANGQPIEQHWEPDNHSIGFVYKMNGDFETVLELSKEHFYETNLDIYLYTSNGDEGLMDQDNGITVVYGK
jgi:hypothetical protein